jgi:regulatory protein
MSTFKENLNTLARFCAYQERCKQDVLKKMSEIGVLPDEKENLLQQLIEEKFFDEQRFAYAYVRGKFKINQWGKNKIKAGLYQKGVAYPFIENALSQIDEEAYLQLAKNLAEKQIPKIKAQNKGQLIQKLFFHLSQKGFESEVIRKAMENK